MRVLQCIDSLRGGGAERQLVYLVEGLVRLGHDVNVVYLLGGTHEERLRASGATLTRLGLRGTARLVADLHGVMRLGEHQVAQTWLGRMSVAGGVAALALGRPWIYSERSAAAHEVGWRATVRRLVGERAHAVVANSEAGAARWRQRLGTRVRVVPNGIELDAIAAAPPVPRAALGVPDDAELVLYAGRFVPPKNIGLLAAALTALLRARPRAVALALGDGEERDAFVTAMARAGLARRCRAPGFVADLAGVWKSADVAIAPSRYEGRPNAVLEAMAARCPLVVSDIDAHNECLPRAAALWFSPASAADAAAALGRALDDRDASRRRAALAFAAVRPFSVDAMARAYAELYASLVVRRARADLHPTLVARPIR